MKLQTRTILAALLICASVGTFRAQAASYEYDFIPDLPLPTGVTSITGSMVLDAPSSTGGSISDIQSYTFVINGTTTYNQNNSTPVITGTFAWDSTTIDTMLLQLSPNSGSGIATSLSVSDSTVNGGGLGHVVSGQWAAVPEQANTFVLLLVTVIAMGGYRTLKQPARREPAVALVTTQP
jgi:hypothetical protein